MEWGVEQRSGLVEGTGGGGGQEGEADGIRGGGEEIML